MPPEDNRESAISVLDRLTENSNKHFPQQKNHEADARLNGYMAGETLNSSEATTPNEYGLEEAWQENLVNLVVDVYQRMEESRKLPNDVSEVLSEDLVPYLQVIDDRADFNALVAEKSHTVRHWLSGERENDLAILAIAYYDYLCFDDTPESMLYENFVQIIDAMPRVLCANGHEAAIRLHRAGIIRYNLNAPNCVEFQYKNESAESDLTSI